MSDDYAVENLIDRFRAHSVYSTEREEAAKKRYIEEFGQEMPIYGPDPNFLITKALMRMCMEISDLKKKLA